VLDSDGAPVSLQLVRRSRFDSVWVPRIGERGAAALRHNNYVRLITVLWLIGAMLAFVVLVRHGTLDVVLGVAAIATAPVALVIQIRSLKRYAARCRTGLESK
jgi:Flp pilus assembly protein TadB